MKICYVFSLESILMSTNNIHVQYKKISPSIIPNLQPLDFFIGNQKEFETAMVKEPSVFEPLKFYCIETEKS